MLKTILNGKRAAMGALKKALKLDGAAPLKRDQASGFAEEHVRRAAQKHAKTLARDAQRHKHKREDERRECFAIAQLRLPDRGFTLDGAILEASSNGLTFRPAANYLEERIGEPIQIVFEDLKKNGVIRSTRVNGYGVQLFEPFSDAEIKRLHASSVKVGRRAA